MPTNSVFISHSSADRVFVETVLLPALDSAGIASWYSPNDIKSSDDWGRSIREGLESAEWFLLVMSPRSQASEWVRDEVMWAVEQRAGRIVPIMVESCDPRAIHIRLARIQNVDLRTAPDEGITRLLELLGVGPSGRRASTSERSIRACRLAPLLLRRAAGL